MGSREPVNRCKHTPEAEPTACQRKAGAQRVEGTCPGPHDQRAAAEVKSGRAWHSCNVTICDQCETAKWFPEGAGLIGLTQVNYLLGKRDYSGCLVTKAFWWGRACDSGKAVQDGIHLCRQQTVAPSRAGQKRDKRQIGNIWRAESLGLADVRSTEDEEREKATRTRFVP